MSWPGQTASFPHIYSENSFQRSTSHSAAPSIRLRDIRRRIKFHGHPWLLVLPAVLLEVGSYSPGRGKSLTLHCSGTRKPHVLNQGSDAGACPVAVSLGRCSNYPQAYSPALPVGTQHYYKSSREAFVKIFRAEGFRGIFRGMDAAILRTSMGSSVQLPSYNWTKTQIVSRGILPADSTLTFLASSTISGICVVCSVLSPLLFSSLRYLP